MKFRIFLFLLGFFLTAAPKAWAGAYEDCVRACPSLPQGNPECVAACAAKYPRGDAPAAYYNYQWQNNFVDQPKPEFDKNVISGIESGGNLQSTSNAIFNYIANSGSSGILGRSGVDANGNPVTTGGAVSFFAKATGALYTNPPASTEKYIAYVLNNAGLPNIAAPAYAAAGIGFNSLEPVLKIWTAVRNLAYLAFAVVFVVIGLMIMLRVKIDPKTVLTIQTALPKIFLSLILITFSYPIAGFLIDLMYVAIGVIIAIFANMGIAGFIPNGQNLVNENVFGYVGAGRWWGIATAAGGGIGDIIARITNNIGGFSGILGVTGGAIATLIFAVAILYALFKTWLMLLGAYINILAGVILSPLAMLGETIPGMSGFGTWVKTMIANLAAFPLVVTLLLFGEALQASVAGKYGLDSSGGIPTNFTPPLIGSGNANAFQAILGFGIIMMIPKATEMLQEWLKSPAFKYGMAWQESVGAGVAVGQKGFGYATRDIRAIKAAREKEEAQQALGMGTTKGYDPNRPMARIARWWPF